MIKKKNTSVYLEITGNFDLINSCYKNPTANIIIDKKDKVFSLRSGTKGCPPHHFFSISYWKF